MGDWVITIQGIGCHHNGPNRANAYDADQMAREFVKLLWKAGHQIEHASFTSGAKDELLPIRNGEEGGE